MTMQPTGDYHCWICGEPGGHGNLPCPKTQSGTPSWAPFQQVQIGTWPPTYDAKLDRIIELLEKICDHTYPPQ